MRKRESLKVMLVGNNPTDLNSLNDRLNDYKPVNYIASTAFSARDAIKKAIGLDLIVLDDNLGVNALKRIIEKIEKHKATKNLAITILKNGNYEGVETKVFHDYLLKEGTGPENLYRSFLQSRNLRKTQVVLYRTYRKGRGKLRSLMEWK